MVQSLSVDEQQRRVMYLKPSEIDVLLTHTRTLREKGFALLLYELGCTLKELVSIRVRDLDCENRCVRIPRPRKSGRCERISHFSDEGRAIVLRMLDEQKIGDKKLAYLFSSSHGGHITVRRATQVLANLIRRAGFEERAHPQVLKYSHIINAYRKGVSVAAIRNQTGLTKQRLIAVLLELEQDSVEGYGGFFGN